MQAAKKTMRDILSCASVMPVLTIHDASVAGDLARALVDGGVLVFEVLMRTPAAADAIRAMVKAAPEAHVGAGTLLRSEDVTRAVDAGAAFGVAPGLTSALAAAVRSARLPFLPGVSSASEVMKAMEFGFSELKLFPAQGGAGVAWLQAMAGVFPSVTFCPTGGIKPGDVPNYLALPNCGTVGCSWVAPADLVKARDWVAITALAAQVAKVRSV
ncbi:MAG: 2-dehydro-3-deoxyphosphogluconate aldolase/4-hydroxy-2-oxoglutarate aldolase [Proteobacteria bacterium]|nr:2-dehydro-3-deoxyphosphogluconate aldolase/4-hydroxy-2-oxoglutarate aldolase [Pseudomonadota bacterium]